MFPSHQRLHDDAPPPGKLFRSKSDETLSVSSSHPSRSRSRHKMSRARASKESQDLKMATYADRAHRLERKIRAYTAKRESQMRDERDTRSKSRDTLHDNHVRQRPLTYHEGQGKLEVHTRVPEGKPAQQPPQGDYTNYNGYREHSLPRNFRDEGRQRRREASPAEWRRPPPQPPVANGGYQPQQYRSSSLEPRAQHDPPLRVRNGSVEPPTRAPTSGHYMGHPQANSGLVQSGSGQTPTTNGYIQSNSGQTQGTSAPQVTKLQSLQVNNTQQHQGHNQIQGHNQVQIQGQRGYPSHNPQVNVPNGPTSGQQNPQYQREAYKAPTNNNYMAQTPQGPIHQAPPLPTRGINSSKSMEFQTPRSEGGYMPHSNTFDSTPSPSGPHQSTPASGSPSGYPGNSPGTPYHHNTPSTTPLTTSPQEYIPSSGGYSPASASFPSPQSASSPDTFQVEAQIHHSKTDSGSNPDSGYSSRIYRLHGQTLGKLTNSTLSSFQSSPDNHNTSNLTNGSVATDQSSRTTNSEDTYNKRGSATFNPVSDVLNAWYQQKVYEAQNKRKPDNRNVYHGGNQGAPQLPPRTYNNPLATPAPQPHRVEIGRATQV